MSIDPNALGASIGPRRRSWTDRDTLLYALGVGAGLDDLPFVTENSKGVEQRVLPTFAVIVAEGNSILAKAGKINWGKMVHGAQGIRLYRPLPAAGEVDVCAEITDLQDKGEGKNAVLTITASASDPVDGALVAESTTTLVFRGAGGFGGEPGTSALRVEIPEREPDVEIEYGTRADQALLYRLSGDRNPLHSDPVFATERAGFPKPILHGLCTYGYAGRAVLAGLCGGDPARLESMHARFAAPVFPGETLRTSIWRTGEGRATFTTTATGEPGAGERLVLDGGQVEYR
ncbi:hypothetical protein LVY72_04895 [Arthrobacter sp. I2-34]|uniref:Uncharacterized protein n=1 Tax=Arthrobacter hankyongi TaxID=2904801 RepID=A0ABS9L3M3_9MICC|nr:MaoC/PaaZ C-terminal domain-containing protein [Arthrobacter hankyongi]MCG2621249.1 hypothetical protein [Arthrobacter hankyongi]